MTTATTTATNTDNTLEIGMFITIPAWKAYGQVISVEPAVIGSDSAIVIKLQEKPGKKAQTYNLDIVEYPGCYVID